VLAAAVKADWVDARTTAIQDLWRCTPPLTVWQLIRAVHLAERTAVGELLIDDSIGVNIESWQLWARAISAASVEITAVIAETHGARPATSLRTSPSPPRGCAVVTLLRAGDLSATRRGRHLCIERDAIESFRHRD
jgi:hypothetical protein